MKKIFTSALFITALFSVRAMAQIAVISQSNLMHNGNFFIYKGVKTDSINVSATGPGLTWNFGALPPDSPQTTSNLQIVLPSATPYASSFPGANLASHEQVYNVYQFFNITSSKYEYQGSVTPGPVTMQYTDPEIIYTLPFSYNSSSSDNYSGDFFGGAAHFYRTGTTTSVGDASGTLITPAGTFNNVLRTKRIEISQDSADLGGFTFIIEYVYTIYEWYGANYGMPLFNYYDMQTNGGQSVITAHYQHSTNVSAGQTEILNEGISFYPNPVSNSGSFNYSLAEKSSVNIRLFDIMGKEVQVLMNSMEEQGDHSVTVSTEGLPSGIYYIRMNASGKVANYRISVL